MSTTSPSLPDPAEAETLRLRQIITDIDLKREQLQQIIADRDFRREQFQQTIADARAKQQQVQIEPIKLLLQAAGVAIGLVAAGAALSAFLLRGL